MLVGWLGKSPMSGEGPPDIAVQQFQRTVGAPGGREVECKHHAASLGADLRILIPGQRSNRLAFTPSSHPDPGGIGTFQQRGHALDDRPQSCGGVGVAALTWIPAAVDRPASEVAGR